VMCPAGYSACGLTAVFSGAMMRAVVLEASQVII